MTFSRRIGLVPEKAIQTGSMDQELRNGLWNCLYSFFGRLSKRINRLSRTRSIIFDDTYMETLSEWLWLDLLKRPRDELEPKWRPSVQQFKQYFMGCAWHEAYDFVEFVANASQSLKSGLFPAILEGSSLLPDFLEACNGVLKRENAGYRFVGTRIVPITSEHEIAGIEGALAATGATASLNLVNAHLKQALALLSDRAAPDYRNSMKESISAVECLCKLIAGNPNATLGQALQAIQRPGSAIMHADMQEALRRLYHYTSDASGIRHALKDAPNVDVEDARFMLVSCAGFISYLIEKARKAGIAL